MHTQPYVTTHRSRDDSSLPSLPLPTSPASLRRRKDLIKSFRLKQSRQIPTRGSGRRCGAGWPRLATSCEPRHDKFNNALSEKRQTKEVGNGKLRSHVVVPQSGTLRSAAGGYTRLSLTGEHLRSFQLFILGVLLFLLPAIEIYSEFLATPLLIAAIFLIFTCRKFFPHAFLLFVFISLLNAQWGMAQFILQHDLHLQLIGESTISNNLPGVAKFGAQKLIRAYGQYPHANVLGGTIAISFLICSFYYKKYCTYHFFIISTLLFLGCVVTFSRAALLSIVLSYLIIIYRQKFHWLHLLLPAIILLLFSPLFYNRLTDANDHSLPERLDGIAWSFKIIQSNPFFGIGFHPYKQSLERYLSNTEVPYNYWQLDYVHSAPLLVLAKIGLGGSFLLFIFSALAWKKWYTASDALIILPILPLLILDHYLLTQATPLIFLFALLFSIILFRKFDGRQFDNRLPL